VLIGVIAAVAAVVLVLVSIQFARGGVSTRTVAYEHVDDQHISLTFSLTMPPGTQATCTAQALNAGRAQVGFVSVDIPVQTQRQSVHTAEIATQGEAVSAEVIECATD
jgi:hypothetical protein